jgi:hypothetical protein
MIEQERIMEDIQQFCTFYDGYLDIDFIGIADYVIAERKAAQIEVLEKLDGMVGRNLANGAFYRRSADTLLQELKQ